MWRTVVVSLLLLSACGGQFATQRTPEQVVAAFMAAGLVVAEPRPMTRDDYGTAPYVGDQGVRFRMSSVGAASAGRIISVTSPADLEVLRTHYTELGTHTAGFFSHVFVRDNILVQLSGDVPQWEAAKYQAVLDGMP